MSNWKYFRVIVIPKIQWILYKRWCEEIHGFWWIHIAKRAPKWDDAEQCNALWFCDTCGRSVLLRNPTDHE